MVMVIVTQKQVRYSPQYHEDKESAKASTLERYTMGKVIQATYHDGNLVLDEKLDIALEGRKLTLILVEETSPSHPEVEQTEKVQDFLTWAQQYSVNLPPDYKFDREEIHDRDCFHRF